MNTAGLLGDVDEKRSDVSEDRHVAAVDAALIIQRVAGLLHAL